MLKERLRSKKNWIYAALACFAMMAVLSQDLSSISAEAAAGGFWNFVAGNIKKLDTNSWDLVFMDIFHTAVSSVTAAGFYVLFARCYMLFICRIFTYTEHKEERAGRMTEWILEEHAFWGPFLIILASIYHCQVSGGSHA